MAKYYGGCDAGSTYTKCVILDETGKIAANITKRSRINPVLSAKDSLDEAVALIVQTNLIILLEQAMDVIKYHLLTRTYQR